jgi:hypothetical protein
VAEKARPDPEAGPVVWAIGIEASHSSDAGTRHDRSIAGALVSFTRVRKE